MSARRRTAAARAAAAILLASLAVAPAAPAHEGHEREPAPGEPAPADSSPPPGRTAPADSSPPPGGTAPADSSTPPGGTAPAPAATADSSPSPAGTPGPPVPLVYRIRPGARADLGWTGIAHGAEWPAEQRLGFAIACRPGEASCRALGGAPGDFFGAPIPLAAGGVPACVVNRLRAGVAGRVEPATGCADLELHLGATVFSGQDTTHPCPVCAEDAAPNDGRREGRCVGGATPGAACDAHGVSTAHGATSTDCLPAGGANVGELVIDLMPLTTGDAGLQAKLSCKAQIGKERPRCSCPAQVQANACIDAPCSSAGDCPGGPVDGTCGGAPHRSCRPGSGRAECEALAAGAGECVARRRACFPDPIAATGTCSPDAPTYVAVFCAAATRAPAINASAGLPGPVRLVLPLERVR